MKEITRFVLIGPKGIEQTILAPMSYDLQDHGRTLKVFHTSPGRREVLDDAISPCRHCGLPTRTIKRRAWSASENPRHRYECSVCGWLKELPLIPKRPEDVRTKSVSSSVKRREVSRASTPAGAKSKVTPHGGRGKKEVTNGS